MNDTLNDTFKILLLGNNGTLKISIVNKYCDDNQFSTASTIGIDFKIENIEIFGKKIKLQLWDTAGQERFRVLTSSLYRNADGVIIVYDVSDMSSFEAVTKWMKHVETNAKNNIVIAMAGDTANEDQRVVSYEMGLSQANGMPFFEIN